MKLVIFDIDGTLTQTNKVDSECFVKAFKDVFSINILNTDWTNYTHVTDSGITTQLFQERFGRLPSNAELSLLQNHFVVLLQQSFRANPTVYGEVPGASMTLRKLQREEEWAVAIATGSWRASALLKLSSSGINVEDLPAAFADDALSREDIIKIASLRAKVLHGNREFKRVVFVGDEVWDAQAAKRLNLGFLGIRTDGDNMRLYLSGASEVLPNLKDYDRFIRALEAAKIPISEYA